MKKIYKTVLVVASVLALGALASCGTTPRGLSRNAASSEPPKAASLKPKPAFSVMDYIEFVLNPVMDGSDMMVVLENDGYKLTFKTDLVFELVDKGTGKTIVGRSGFEMSLKGDDPTVYLLRLDSPSDMSREEFLESDYKRNANIVLVPDEASAYWVGYRVLKSDVGFGPAIRFARELK